VQRLVGDKPGTLGCQKHRSSGYLARLHHAAEQDRGRRRGLEFRHVPRPPVEADERLVADDVRVAGGAVAGDEKLPLKFGSVFLLRANVARPVRGKGDNRCYYLPILSASLSADAVLMLL
jgi:hypothetical protein